MQTPHVLQPLLDEDDYAIYTVGQVRNKWRFIMSYIAQHAPDLPLMPPWQLVSGIWYLVAVSGHGTLVHVRGLRQPHIVETIAIPDWHPSWKTRFDQIVVNDRLFMKLHELPVGVLR